MSDLSITVAIVTARKNEHTHYEKWRKVRDAFLNRQFSHSLLNGELGALLALVFQRRTFDGLHETNRHHVDFQMQALLAGTDLPEHVIIIDREQRRAEKFTIRCVSGESTQVHHAPPMISARELALVPNATLATLGEDRTTRYSFGCADKNTAIALCNTDVLVMLDDCCLPSFGLIAAVREHYEREERRWQFEPETFVPTVMPLAHRQLYMQPGVAAGLTSAGTQPSLEHSDANWTTTRVSLSPAGAQQMRRVFGVWAMPTPIVRTELNGFNTLLDGVRGGDDEELLERCDRYLTAKKGEYVFDPRARLYEVGHDMPWQSDSAPVGEWKKYCPDGWTAPGPALAELQVRGDDACAGAWFLRQRIVRDETP